MVKVACRAVQLVAIAAAMGVPCAAQARVPPQFRAGASVGALAGDVGGSSAGTSLGVDAGWAFASVAEVEVGALASLHPGARPGRWMGGLDALLLHRIDVGRVTPYLGVGLAAFSERALAGTDGPQRHGAGVLVIGLDWWQSPKLAVGARVRWFSVTNDPLERAFPAFGLFELTLRTGL